MNGKCDLQAGVSARHFTAKAVGKPTGFCVSREAPEDGISILKTPMNQYAFPVKPSTAPPHFASLASIGLLSRFSAARSSPKFHGLNVAGVLSLASASAKRST